MRTTQSGTITPSLRTSRHGRRSRRQFHCQNADLLLVLGSRLNIRQVSYNWRSFAARAKKIWVDIDAVELQKPSVHADIPIHADLADLLPVLAARKYCGPSTTHAKWLVWSRQRNTDYPVVPNEYWAGPQINPYCFMKSLFEHLSPNQIVVTANGSACVVSFQAAHLKPGQRLWTNSGCASMGYDLPSAIGACKASEGAPIVCLAGDGSIMMNLQELQTIVGSWLPIKIFLLNNSGYVSIFQTHRNFFNGVEVGRRAAQRRQFSGFRASDGRIWVALPTGRAAQRYSGSRARHHGCGRPSRLRSDDRREPSLRAETRQPPTAGRRHGIPKSGRYGSFFVPRRASPQYAY